MFAFIRILLTHSSTAFSQYPHLHFHYILYQLTFVFCYDYIKSSESNLTNLVMIMFV